MKIACKWPKVVRGTHVNGFCRSFHRHLFSLVYVFHASLRDSISELMENPPRKDTDLSFKDISS